MLYILSFFYDAQYIPFISILIHIQNHIHLRYYQYLVKAGNNPIVIDYNGYFIGCKHPI